MAMTTCEVCGKECWNIDSRQGAAFVRRRYRCAADHRFTTYEFSKTRLAQMRSANEATRALGVMRRALEEIEVDRRLIMRRKEMQQV